MTASEEKLCELINAILSYLYNVLNDVTNSLINPPYLIAGSGE